MDYSFEKADNVVVLNVSGNVLTGIHNGEILNEVTNKISEDQNKMVIHLGGTKYINSNGLNLLLNVLTKCRKAGGEVVLANVPDELSRLLIMTKLNSIFITRDSQQEAVEYLKNLDN